ncbi:hypothetical protein SERLA73DRAFT_121622 [Serpula lacrymans var. lacrymans S7.3]|uniref:BHLH domain-containing protein n=2 Tax=Serpula lacrymans var. lacrymans TaxID=341189 RepID=F8PSI0_SERL3|nr:uncharacterized protein SERLADRAFT_368467 [Serpula lacrymans var. lacrymans S7.9]EGO01310.1 hypothetical protein SERLA73DRAFT_121622 [Serpula lacrymans var. lacrymans S7.3]EGO26950.1 hypothetical protein SERLADRAFT_368467 [Serpula lacrymans var. lacrymans S7.9]
MPHNDRELYAASCNPPRRAKRLRSDSAVAADVPAPVSPLLALDKKPRRDAAQSVEDSDYDDPSPPTPPPKRRGRKPGPLSRVAREAQRKINHSLIEKARRTKINDALATLRQLVPADYKRQDGPATPDDDDGSEDEEDGGDKTAMKQKSPSKSKSGEKEFKLEILVRTVAYLQDLTDKLRLLEDGKCHHCHQAAAGQKRKRDDKSHEECNAAEVATGVYTQEESSRAVLRDSPRKAAHQSTRLPSISTWLPHKTPLLTPSQSPSLQPLLSASSYAKHPVHQLPSPPTSGTFHPESNANFQAPPILTLPSPGTQTRAFHPPPKFSMKGVPSRANVSPLISPEDESAASLLLQMSASPTSSVAKLGPPSPSRHHGHMALTPSSLLGLGDDT